MKEDREVFKAKPTWTLKAGALNLIMRIGSPKEQKNSPQVQVIGPLLKIHPKDILPFVKSLHVSSLARWQIYWALFVTKFYCFIVTVTFSTWSKQIFPSMKDQNMTVQSINNINASMRSDGNNQPIKRLLSELHACLSMFLLLAESVVEFKLM